MAKLNIFVPVMTFKRRLEVSFVMFLVSIYVYEDSVKRLNQFTRIYALAIESKCIQFFFDCILKL